MVRRPRCLQAPCSRWVTAAAGMMTLVAIIRENSADHPCSPGLGPGASRRLPNSPVEAVHPRRAEAAIRRRPATSANRPPAAAATVSACRPSRPLGTSATRRQSPSCRRRIRASSPLPACARTLTQKPAGRTGCRTRAPPDEPPAGLPYPQRQVGVLAVGTRKSLVEAVHIDQRGAPVRVGRRPCGGLQAGGVALPVGGARVCGKRHDDAALAARDVGTAARQVVDEAPRPAGRRYDIVVEERDPLRRGQPPAQVPAAAGPRPPAITTRCRHGASPGSSGGRASGRSSTTIST